MNPTTSTGPRARRMGMALLMALGLVAPVLRAQEVVPLITFTNVWRYDDSGLDRGTNWRTRTFNDSAWAAGRPLFGYETAQPFPYAPAGFSNMTTALPLTSPGTTVQTITYYFRTHFQLPGTNVAGVVLVATNYLDDGCVIHLDGVEAGRIRVPAGQSWQTFASSGPPVEGQAEVTSLNAAALLPGDNVLAVEVHQLALPNSDIAFALSLTALVPQSLVLTQPPASQSVVVDRPVTFSAGVSGGPALYQWFRNGVSIGGATGANYSISAAPYSLAGAYRVRVTNAVSAVESADALLTVLPDNAGPLLISAVAQEGTLTNRIIVTCSERVGLLTVTNVANYTLSLTGTAEAVPIVSAFRNNTTIQLSLGTNEWRLGAPYILTVRGVTDFYGNVIAPDTQVGIGWPRRAELVATNAVWDFHAAALFDPGVFAENWTAPDYVPGPWWSQGEGPLCGGQLNVTPCMGVPRSETGYQQEPTLFRTAFIWPAGASAEPPPVLRFTVNADDGVVLYLDGAEVLRTNLPAGPVASSLRATLSGNAAACYTFSLPVTNFAVGPHTLAAAVAQMTVNGLDGDSLFGCVLQADYYVTSPVPAGPAPVLSIATGGAGEAVVSWMGNGFALESAGQLGGAWLQVTNVSNPFTNAATGLQRFFRLRK